MGGGQTLQHAPGVEDVEHGRAVYDLFGVVNHFGSMNFGHYTAYGKSRARAARYGSTQSHACVCMLVPGM